jgi:hypothetical protein
MPSYKVSYKILRQQGDDMKAVAKLVDGYSERVAQVSGKLGEGDLLAQVRTNLGKLREQLGESRTVLHTAGEFLTKTVDSYTGVEIRQVKKADSTRAHNRDFYKNPVVVASVGGAAAGGAAAVAAPTVSAPAPSAPTMNYTDNSVNVNYVAVESAPAAAAPAAPVAAPVSMSAPVAPAPVAAPVTSVPAAGNVSAGIGAGVAAGAGVIGGVLGAGAVIGVKHLINENKKDKAAAAEQQEKDRQDAAQAGYDPEAELEKAIARVQELEKEDV